MTAEDAAGGRFCDFRVTAQDQGVRLDVFLSGQDVALSRSRIKRMVEERLVFVNGREAKAGQKLREGDMVRLLMRDAAAPGLEPEKIPISVLYEDESLLVVDKPPGLVVHPGAGRDSGTLVNALLHHCTDLRGIGGVLRPGIVHRLDKDTSGLMVVAKTEQALDDLSRQFKEREVDKRYLAFVWGDMIPDEDRIELPVGRHPVDRKRMSTSSRRGREAVTCWKVMERYGEATLAELTLKTGRTHQIRVHLTAAGHPVIGDHVYGQTSRRISQVRDAVLQSRLKTMKRQALHAARLEFRHPVTGKRLSFESSLPADMERMRGYLRAYAEKKYGS
ncbi:MAG: RluA family pseudouridine synthase [Syntrophales bacterium]|nr:RluA family pseudouridine synthase [Syntrophales bacterium]MDD5231972.1 RluA family pseudouridine synthase [Syntrophales bacterium]MDD5532113.1 RluA family pseudouridine synthase [Syntrophales bacterium]HPL63615.1 RluA family pseudouridine synthase [Syntrophales bacterium]